MDFQNSLNMSQQSPNRSSQLPVPSKLPSTTGGPLTDINLNETNLRSNNQNPKHTVPSKRHLSNVKPVTQPQAKQPKREGLKERAGQLPNQSFAAPPSNKPVPPNVFSTVENGIRNISNSSTATSRTASSYTRTASSSSSVGNSSGTQSTRGYGSRAFARPVPPSSITKNDFHRSTTGIPNTTSSGHYAGVDLPNFASSQNAPWDVQTKLESFEKQLKTFDGLKEQIDAATSSQNNLQDQVSVQKIRLNELETIRAQLTNSNECLKSSNNSLLSSNANLEADKTNLQRTIDNARAELNEARDDLERSRRKYKEELDDLSRKHKLELEDLQEAQRKQGVKTKDDAIEERDRLHRTHQEEIDELRRRLRSELEEERSQASLQIDSLSKRLATTEESAEKAGADKQRELQELKEELQTNRANTEAERSITHSLKDKVTELTTTTSQQESTIKTLRDHVNFLESDSQAQSQAFGDLHQKMQDAIDRAGEYQVKLRGEETLRRKLHNQVQELKGNIRVFCRVRPTLENESDDKAKISFPDEDKDMTEVSVLGPEQKSSLGTVTTKPHNFSFDRAFGPASKNFEVFDEISQLVQSALDGYNVCIFCYGQTGSGKTYTMSAEDGMIPLAVNQIYETATSLEEKGWKYTMEGAFVEVYNETLNDLLGKAEDLDKKKLEIRHDQKKGKTTITDVSTMALDSPKTLESLLQRASKNRSVAATKANERSSRSHSVFMLTLTGQNSFTGERSEGTLNLVDLAGSERLAHSGATGDRLKETQNINRSLSCLGDVISALGQGKDGTHVPYRNSKLTYLLQNSLGGNSKTLMFVMVSPLMGHLGETLTSLKFATKVHNTHIGTAKKQSKVKD